MTLQHLKKISDAFPATEPMPVLFVGHGSPMNAIEDNPYSEAWTSQGQELPRPQAILCISAHWFTRGTFVHGSAHPKTIHDFWGFPQALYDLRYPCAGSPELAREVQGMVEDTTVQWDEDWGLDHGTWIVLHRMFPQANIPVFQLSIDFTKPSQFHYDLAKELQPLRKKGVLIIGSGNVVHNLGMGVFDEAARPYEWASAFDARVHDLIAEGNHQPLIHYEKIGHEAMLSIPTPDHYWPLLYTLGLQGKKETVKPFVGGITHGSISMMSLRMG